MTNPLITSLPKILSKSEFTAVFAQNPVLDATTKEQQYVQLRRVKDTFAIPFNHTYLFYLRVATIIVASYEVRTPKWLIQKLYEDIDVDGEEVVQGVADILRTTQHSFGTYLSGFAGVGKTTILNFLLTYYPKFIVQPKLGVTQIPLLKIELPSAATRKDLCKAIIAGLDDTLGTKKKDRYSEQLTWLSENDLVDFLKRRLLVHFVGTIFIDEFQDLKVRKNGASEHTVALIKKLSNSLCIPLVLVGQPQIEEIIAADYQLATRFQSVKWSGFKRNEQYRSFIEKLYGYTFLKNQKLDEAISELFFDLSKGNPRTIVNLYIESQILTLQQDKDVVTKQLIFITYNVYFQAEFWEDESHRRYLVEKYPELSSIKKNEQFKGRIPQNASKSKSEEPTTTEVQKQSPKAKPQVIELIDIPLYEDSSLLTLMKSASNSVERISLLKEQGFIKEVSEFLVFE